jgi:CTP synthase
VDTLVMKYLHLEAKDQRFEVGRYSSTASITQSRSQRIGIVGKYVEYEDSYKSLKEALVHGALAHNLKLQVKLD